MMFHPTHHSAFSHVNNVRYAEWFESARIKYWDSLEHEFPASEGNMVSEPADSHLKSVPAADFRFRAARGPD